MATDDELAVAVHAALRERGWTLAVAESCTGGLLGGALTRVPGSSATFRGGVIAYANDVKARLLGVPGEVLARRGAVSPETARAMAEGAARALAADVGVGVTGVAGPDGGTAAKPVGLVYVAVAGAGGVQVRELRLPGDRDAVRAAAVRVALEMVRTVVGSGLK